MEHVSWGSKLWQPFLQVTNHYTLENERLEAKSYRFGSDEFPDCNGVILRFHSNFQECIQVCIGFLHLPEGKKQSIVLLERESYMERDSKPTTFPIDLGNVRFLPGQQFHWPRVFFNISIECLGGGGWNQRMLSQRSIRWIGLAYKLLYSV